MLSDPAVALRARGVDARWHEQRLVGPSVPGFNPFLGSVFYCRNCALADWLREPAASAREINHNDRLLRPLLIAVHDYLHVWATRLIQSLVPEMRFGVGHVTRSTFDDHVFCLLLTEAAAVVGLDYWYLCTVDLNEVLPIGTRLSEGLTVPYHERHAAEYRRFNPRLDVQSPRFFGELCRFYCSGAFRGFDRHDLVRSPLLFAWMSREIGYGEKQRAIARSWLAHLARDEIRLDPSALSARVDVDAPARQALVEAVGGALWRMVKEDMAFAPCVEPPEPATSPRERRPDFRFTNINALDDDRAFAPRDFSPEEFTHLFAQAVSRCDRDAFDRTLIEAFPALLEKRDPALLRAALRDQPRVATGNEPRDLLFTN